MLLILPEFDFCSPHMGSPVEKRRDALIHREDRAQ
jgi:hypothetical protein